MRSSLRGLISLPLRPTTSLFNSYQVYYKT